MKRTSGLLAAALIVFMFSVQANATLFLRGTDTLGNQLIYDDDLNITWYDYTNPYDIWWNQVNWADALTVDFNGTIYDDWRLPITTQPDPSCSYQYNPGGGFPLQGYGYNCTGSEMGHLYYMELGNSAGGPLSTSFTDGSTGATESFQNLQPVFYWSGTEYVQYVPNTTLPFSDFAWAFYFNYGLQGLEYKGYGGCNCYGLAVRPGDVSARGPASVPEPATMLLLGTGLAGMAAFRKRPGRIHR